MKTEEIKKYRIMDYAFGKFTSLGISQITMDDIARGVGMGKGTLYKFFPSKEVLVLHTIDYIVGQIEKVLENILVDDTLTTPQKLNLFLKTVAGRLSKINPNVLEYMERSMPEAFEKIKESRERIIQNYLVRLFEDGKKNGLFDQAIDVRLVTQMLIGAVNHITNSHILLNSEYTLDQLFISLTSILLRGCLTEEARVK